MNDLVQVAAHEIGHALGLWHSRDIRALMHPNATYSRTWRIGHDDVWAIQRLYGEGLSLEAAPKPVSGRSQCWPLGSAHLHCFEFYGTI